MHYDDPRCDHATHAIVDRLPASVVVTVIFPDYVRRLRTENDVFDTSKITFI